MPTDQSLHNIKPDVFNAIFHMMENLSNNFQAKVQKECEYQYKMRLPAKNRKRSRQYIFKLLLEDKFVLKKLK